MIYLPKGIITNKIVKNKPIERSRGLASVTYFLVYRVLSLCLCIIIITMYQYAYINVCVRPRTYIYIYTLEAKIITCTCLLFLYFFPRNIARRYTVLFYVFVRVWCAVTWGRIRPGATIVLVPEADLALRCPSHPYSVTKRPPLITINTAVWPFPPGQGWPDLYVYVWMFVSDSIYT